MRKAKRVTDIRQLRVEAEAAIEQLIDLLDRTDPYHAELEDEHDGREPDVDDEPSLGSSNDTNGSGTNYQSCIGTGILDGEGPDDDLEPSLGSLNDPHGTGAVYGFGDRDLESDLADNEPSLGWTEAFAAGEGGHPGPPLDFEISAPVDVAAARERYVASKIDGHSGKGVIVERGYASRRLGGLTDQQRRAFRAKTKGKVSAG